MSVCWWGSPETARQFTIGPRSWGRRVDAWVEGDVGITAFTNILHQHSYVSKPIKIQLYTMPRHTFLSQGQSNLQDILRLSSADACGCRLRIVVQLRYQGNTHADSWGREPVRIQDKKHAWQTSKLSSSMWPGAHIWHDRAFQSEHDSCCVGITSKGLTAKTNCSAFR